ncbi:MAG: hypothetical protein U5K28_12030 [Halobacteriales archaeon]|nr:hypothetical protein [Halobacteriales archaeon]
MSSQYEPGVCNIGGEERQQRRRYAAIAFVAALVYLIAVLASSLPTVLLVGLFIPLSIGFEMALQARRAFCANLALSGEYAFDDEIGQVTDLDARRRDRTTGLKLTVLGIVGGAVTTALVYGVANLL